MGKRLSVLIAGCGDLGSRLGLQLSRDGWTVYGLRRNAAQLAVPILPVNGDLSEPTCPRCWPNGSLDYLVYAASATEHDEAGYRQAYVEGLVDVDGRLSDIVEVAHGLAASAQPTLTGMALMLNSTPSSTKASALLSVPGAMNCGTKARKKMATLGLSTLVQKPPRNTLRSGVCGAGAACAAASATVPPIDSLQDMRGEMLEIMGQLGDVEHLIDVAHALPGGPDVLP